MCKRSLTQFPELPAVAEPESALPLSELSHPNIRLWNDLSSASSSLECTAHTPPSDPELSGSVSGSASDSASRTSDDMAKDAEADRMKLETFNIWVDSLTDLPRELQEHVNRILNAPRLQSSPAAKNLYHNKRRAERQNESTGIDILASDLLFAPEAEGGERYISRLTNIGLDRVYLPATPSPPTTETLAQAICDTAMCYVTSWDAIANGSVFPLSAYEEQLIHEAAITPKRHFPYLTCQWKSRTSSESLVVAGNQGARDGAAIVNYLQAFYESAGITPSVVDTCHWSLTCDMHIAMLWVHWAVVDKETKTMKHHMTLVDQEFLRASRDPSNAAMARFRQGLRNIQNWAVGQRLEKLKAAISEVQKKITLIPKRAGAAKTQNNASGSTAASETGTPGASEYGSQSGSSKRQKLTLDSFVKREFQDLFGSDCTPGPSMTFGEYTDLEALSITNIGSRKAD